MGRAIVRRPQVFLMDEPLSNLDAKLRVQMRAEISRLQHDLGVTTVYVTHDQTEAMTMGDRVAVLSDGRLQQIDTPQRLYDHPDNLFVATFIGSPQMNLVLGRMADDGTSVTLGEQRLDIPQERRVASPRLREFEGREVIVGIRPETLEDASLDGGAVSGRSLPVRVLLREGLGSEVVVRAQLDAPAPAVETAQGENTLLTESSGVGLIARLDPRTQVAARRGRGLHRGRRAPPLLRPGHGSRHPRLMRVNGSDVDIDVDASADDVLLWVLRDDLGLAAAKYGCGLDQCGACRVLIDGRPVSSCQLRVGDVGGREVTTLEALVGTAEGRAVVDALLARNAGQCGYCLPGIAVTLISLARDRAGSPVTRAEVAAALDPHLCRCGSQPRILAAAIDVLGG